MDIQRFQLWIAPHYSELRRNRILGTVSDTPAGREHSYSIRVFLSLLRRLGPVQKLSPADIRTIVIMWVAGIAQGYAGAHAVNTLPFSRITLGLSEGDMAGLLAVTRVGALLALLTSVWSDRTGRKAPYLASLGMLFSGAAATGLAQSSAAFTLAQVATRWGSTGAAILGAILLIESVPNEVRGFAVSVYAAATSLGSGAATVAVGWADRSPETWRWIFGSSALALLVIPFLAVYLKPPPSAPDRVNQWWPSVNTRTFLLLAVASLTLASFTAVSVSFTFERLIDDIGFSSAGAATLSLVAGTLGGIGFFVGGRLADTWGRGPTAVLSSILALSGGTSIFFSSTIAGLSIATFVAAFGSFMLAPSLGTLRNESFTEDVRTRAVTWVNTIALIGSAGGLFYANRFIDSIGLPSTVLRLSGVALVGIWALHRVPDTTSRVPT